MSGDKAEGGGRGPARGATEVVPDCDSGGGGTVPTPDGDGQATAIAGGLYSVMPHCKSGGSEGGTELD